MYHFYHIGRVSQHLFSSSALVEMRSIYIRQLVRPVAVPLVMRMRGYIWGVATVRIYPYPALESIDCGGSHDNLLQS